MRDTGRVYHVGITCIQQEYTRRIVAHQSCKTKSIIDEWSVMTDFVGLVQGNLVTSAIHMRGVL